MSLGFAFGAEGNSGYPLARLSTCLECLDSLLLHARTKQSWSKLEHEVYISDIKELPPETAVWLEAAAQSGIDVFMVDALSRTPHPTHMSFDEALELVRRLRPRRTPVLSTPCQLHWAVLSVGICLGIRMKHDIIT